jgi:hypothetical protein
MATKKLTVPQNGTQPATIPSPIDNMISTSCKKIITNRRPTSFNIDQELMLKFKTVCVQQGRPMSSVVEELISKFVDSVC